MLVSSIRSKKPTRIKLLSIILFLIVLVVVIQYILFESISSCQESGTSQRARPWMHSGSKERPFRTSQHDKPSSDAVFNGAPLYLVSGQLESRVHCVGDNYLEDSWTHRSCYYTNLCFNVSNREFIVFQSESDRRLEDLYSDRPLLRAATTRISRNVSSQEVALGALNQKWGKGMTRLKFSPKVLPASTVKYYRMDSHDVFLPFHSINGANPGHLVWDDFLPMYKILTMFDLLEKRLLPLRYVIEDGERGLWASCDLREDKRIACEKVMSKFAPLITGPSSYKLTSTTDFLFTGKDSDLVCAPHALVGLNDLSDHGTKGHGWEARDYKTVQNSGLGGIFYDFRVFALRNIGLDPYATRRPKLVVSQASSQLRNRNHTFIEQIEMIKKEFPNIEVHAHVMSTLSLMEQIQLVHDASFYISQCGGGAVNAMFLPRDASVILYHRGLDGLDASDPKRVSAILDWDLFNSMSHLRVHWLQVEKKVVLQDLPLLKELISHEIDQIL